MKSIILSAIFVLTTTAHAQHINPDMGIWPTYQQPSISTEQQTANIKRQNDLLMQQYQEQIQQIRADSTCFIYHKCDSN
jgi:hypothetical protein